VVVCRLVSGGTRGKCGIADALKSVAKGAAGLSAFFIFWGMG
jgi:hypothetical protein